MDEEVFLSDDEDSGPQEQLSTSLPESAEKKVPSTEKTTPSTEKIHSTEKLPYTEKKTPSDDQASSQSMPDNKTTPKSPKRSHQNISEKAEESVKVTAESEQARAEIEAEGIHVKDFATGYSTIVTDRA